MAYLYPDEVSASNSGRKTYWGSLYGSADALALIEYVQQQPKVVLLIADDIWMWGKFIISQYFPVIKGKDI